MSTQNHSATRAWQASRGGVSLPFAPLNKDSYTPIYAQIQAQLLEMIRSGKLQPGDLLPSE